MSFFSSLALFGLLALVGYNVIVYLQTSGTTAERLAAAWKNSMTLFALIWATFVAFLMNGMASLSAITGDPQFVQFGDALKSAVPAQWGQWIVVATLLLPLIAGAAGRARTINVKVG